MDRWHQALVRCFRQKGLDAQETLDGCHYSLQDAKNGRTPRSYVQDIIRYAKATQLPLYKQLLLAYTKMHFKFRVHLAEPTTSTTLSSFLEQLGSQANALLDIARDDSGGIKAFSSSETRTSKVSTNLSHHGNWRLDVTSHSDLLCNRTKTNTKLLIGRDNRRSRITKDLTSSTRTIVTRHRMLGSRCDKPPVKDTLRTSTTLGTVFLQGVRGS